MAAPGRLLLGAVRAGAFTAAVGSTLSSEHGSLADMVLRRSQQAPTAAVQRVRREDAADFDMCDTEEIDFKEAVTFLNTAERQKQANEMVAQEIDADKNAVFVTVSRAPPNDAEVCGALDTIASRPAILADMVPRQVYQDPIKLNHLLEAVRTIVSDPDLINAARLRILSAQQEQEPLSFDAPEHEKAASPVVVSAAPASAEEEAEEAALEQWEGIRAKYPCVICQDVLSAPCILNCSHSFCGQCINDLMGACVPVRDDQGNEENEENGDDDGSGDVVFSCPCCKVEIVNATFERILDEDIAVLVGQVPPCAPKEAWSERRAASVKKMRKKAAQAAARQRRAQLGSGGENGEEEEEMSWSELVTEWAPPITFLVLVIIVACRSR